MAREEERNPPISLLARDVEPFLIIKLCTDEVNELEAQRKRVTGL